MTLLVTGGAGFIGSALVRRLIADGRRVVTVDRLSYSGDRANLGPALDNPLHAFEQADIADAGAMKDIFTRYRPEAVLHLAAESHVDRSIDGPLAFVTTNVVGTAILLETFRAWRDSAPQDQCDRLRFLHVSTDEVFGALGPDGAFDEDTPYDPSSPYSSTKAGSDFLARAWARTYGLDVVVTNCSNNYGPRQHAEKLIPTLVLNAVAGRPLPIYGSGLNVRDWLYVEDHVDGLIAALDRGERGGTYLFGGGVEKTTLDVAHAVCAVLDRLRPGGAPHARLIQMVEDRPGHDFRYAIDSRSARAALGWAPAHGWEDGLEATVAWYLERAEAGALHAGDRLGLGGQPDVGEGDLTT